MRGSIQQVKDKFKNQKGFTLIELMAVLVILALILLIAVPAGGALIEKAKKKADESSIELIEKAGEQAHVDKLPFDADAPEKDSYNVPTLIKEGYLKLKPDSKFTEPGEYVQKKNKGGEFVYKGKYGKGGAPGGDNGGNPGDGGATGPTPGAGAGTVDTALTCEAAEAEGYTCIYTPQEFDAIRNTLDGKFILMNDISLADFANWNPIGTSGAPFKGILNGNGKKITNLVIGTSPAVGQKALFGVMSYGEISNVSIADATLDRGNEGGSETSAFLIAQVVSTVETNADAKPLKITNISITGTAKNASEFGTLIGYALDSNNPITVSKISTNVAISGMGSAAGLIGWYDPSYTDASLESSLSVKNIAINGSIAATSEWGAASGLIRDFRLDRNSDDVSTFESITVAADVTAAGSATGFAQRLSTFSGSHQLVVRDVTVSGNVTSTSPYNSASGFAQYYDTSETGGSLVENITIAGNVTAGNIAAGFAHNIGFDDSITGVANVIKGVKINGKIIGGYAILFADDLYANGIMGDVSIEDVTIKGSAEMGSILTAFRNINSRGNEGEFKLSGFNIDVTAAQKAGQTSGLDSTPFINYAYVNANDGNFVVRDIMVNADITSVARVIGFAGEIEHSNYSATNPGRVIFDGIDVGGTLTSTGSNVEPFIASMKYADGMSQGAVDVKNVTIDYKMSANNGTAFTPKTVDDMKTYYNKYTFSGLLPATAGDSVIENIAATYDTSGHTGAMQAAH